MSEKWPFVSTILDVEKLVKASSENLTDLNNKDAICKKFVFYFRCRIHASIVGRSYKVKGVMKCMLQRIGTYATSVSSVQKHIARPQTCIDTSGWCMKER